MNILHSVEGLQGFSIAATDGELGHVKDVYFDDRQWAIRYLVVDTGGWLSGRKVLISPASVEATDWNSQTIAVNLSRAQVQNSPDIDTEKPVSRQHEQEYYDYYGYPYYWNGPYLWGFAILPGMLEQKPLQDRQQQALRDRLQEERARDDPHLRSGAEVTGYDIQATDDAIGHVEDLLFDDENWKIELMVVDTRNWWPGKKVMVSPARITRVSWEGKIVEVDISRDEVEHSPEYDPAKPPVQEAGRGLFRHPSYTY